MARTKKNDLDKLIERSYYQQGNGVQINIMNIPRLFSECRTAILGGTSVDDAVQAAIAKYREN